MIKKIGIIGLGDIAQKAYLPVLANHGQVEVAGLMSTTRATVERIGDKYRIAPRFTDLASLLKLDLDAVFVHSPTDTHASTVMECLSGGLHVYVDKPLSYDIRESARMVEMAEKHNRLLCVGFNRRFAPRYLEAKAWLEEAGGMDLCMVQKHRIKQQKHSAKHTLYDDLIHMIDLLVWLGGGPHKLLSYERQIDAAGRLMHASGHVSFGNAAASFSMDRSAGADLEKLELHGSGRSVEVVNLDSAVFYEKDTGASTKSFGSWDTTLYKRGFVGVIEHFLNTMDSPEQCTIRGDLVMDTHRLVEQLSLES